MNTIFSSIYAVFENEGLVQDDNYGRRITMKVLMLNGSAKANGNTYGACDVKEISD